MGTVPVAFRMEKDLVNRLDEIRQELGLKNRSDIVIKACRDFVKQYDSPGLNDQKILEVFERNRDYLKAPVREVLEEIFAQQVPHK